ncbi:MAG TPA: helix-turn-helix transcriptional regulator [Burkholderiales bacterium]|nr:helix-turn-helix transcriptional regulator [Burkholderiales bacterium]
MARIRSAPPKGRSGGKHGAATNIGVGTNLTAREIDVLQLLSRGYTYAKIGKQLGISLHTVTSHIKKSYRKLGAHSAAEAVTRAAELHLLDRSRDG